MSPCVSCASPPTTPTSPPAENNNKTNKLQLHISVPGTGLSSVMYATDRYLPQQSSDSFDIFIKMSSIINHLKGSVGGGGKWGPSLPLCTASDYKWKTELSDVSPRVSRLTLLPVSRLKFRLLSNIRRRQNIISITLCKWALVSRAWTVKQPSILHLLLSKLEVETVGQAGSTSCSVRVWCHIILNRTSLRAIVHLTVLSPQKGGTLMHCLGTIPCPFASQ